KVRDYGALQYEILFRKIMKLKSISFTIEDSFKEHAMEIFPLLFETTKDIFVESSDIFDEKQSKSEEKNYNEILNSITSKLIGHEEFKKDFRRNFLKFSYLKELKQRKILSILICGESGVGKTEFAKITSEAIYPGDSLIKINFGNYSTEGVLNSLIGSPIGYVGSEEGGELINKMVSSNSKVILIDEFEKATPSVYNFFYELLEDGKFTDRHGKEHDLDGYIIIFTSNMTEKQYKECIPDSLKSRFDMTYSFNYLTAEERLEYINKTAVALILELNKKYNVDLNLSCLSPNLEKLVENNNLRNIKRQVEDIIFNDFLQKQLV
ncbi:ATP-dependent Clp protease ATP-binding subunit, partial [Enterococcus faecium]|nr:ATP-dependent Clp protease ATP-binding subunit [Enterococcus faecium]